MKLVTNRDCEINSLTGHYVAFKADVPRDVPAAVVAECMAIGAVPDKGEKVAVSAAAIKEQEALVPVGPEREDKIIEAMERLVIRNKRGDFSGTGLPVIGSIRELVGFEVDVKERDIIWNKVRAELV